MKTVKRRWRGIHDAEWRRDEPVTSPRRMHSSESGLERDSLRNSTTAKHADDAKGQVRTGRPWRGCRRDICSSRCARPCQVAEQRDYYRGPIVGESLRRLAPASAASRPTSTCQVARTSSSARPKALSIPRRSADCGACGAAERGFRQWREAGDDL